MTDKFKKGLQNWLQIQPVSPYHVSIQSYLDFETAAIRNKIWYRADGNELEQLYQQCRMLNDAQKFWGGKAYSGHGDSENPYRASRANRKNAKCHCSSGYECFRV